MELGGCGLQWPSFGLVFRMDKAQMELSSGSVLMCLSYGTFRVLCLKGARE